MLLEVFLTFLSIAILLVLYFRWNYGTLERLGIPVVKTHFLLGSQSDFYKIIGHERDYEWFQTHGEIYGVYNGRQPEIHIIDPEFVRKIFITDFDKFVNRSFDLGTKASSVLCEMMDFIKDDKWKTVRAALSPMYTTAKLKRLNLDMIGATDDILNLLLKDISSAPNEILQDYNIYGDLFAIVLDATARCSLNIKIQNPRSPDNEFTKAVMALIPQKSFFMASLLNIFPELSKFIGIISTKAIEEFFIKVFQQVMTERRKSKDTNDDFIDLLNIMVDKTTTEEYKKLGISEITVLAQAVDFFTGGINGITTAMSALILYTSQNPEIAQKLYEEVDAYFRRNKGHITHDNLAELKYLNACVYEALRLHPGFTRPDRLCNVDVEYKGIKIKKGMTVVVPVWSYNRNPKYFPDPHTFNPERFMPHNKYNTDMFTFGTFGHGPRMCTGMRFAIEFMLIMGVKLFKNFRFTTQPGAQMEYFPTFFPGMSVLNPTNVAVAKRSKVDGIEIN